MSQAIQEQLKRLENEVVRLAPFAVVVCDEHENVQIANLEATKLIAEIVDGVEPDNVAGMNVRTAFANLDLDVEPAIWHLLEMPRNQPPIEFLRVPIDMAGRHWNAIYLSRVKSHRERLLEKEASTDELSGLPNRRAFQRTMESHQSGVLSLAIIDIDHFKSINDELGHLIGDDVIRLTSQTLIDSFGENSILVSRMGGDEFSVLFHTTNENEIIEALESFREQIASCELSESSVGRPTVSIGAAISMVPNAGTRTLLTYADRQLYKAKHAGRNRVAYVVLDDKQQAD